MTRMTRLIVAGAVALTSVTACTPGVATAADPVTQLGREMHVPNKVAPKKVIKKTDKVVKTDVSVELAGERIRITGISINGHVKGDPKIYGSRAKTPKPLPNCVEDYSLYKRPYGCKGLDWLEDGFQLSYVMVPVKGTKGDAFVVWADYSVSHLTNTLG